MRFGIGRINELGEACKSLGLKRPLFITDQDLAELDITKNAHDIIRLSGLDVDLFSEVAPNPDEKHLTLGLQRFREGRHDGVIAFGGGSGIDLGKLIGFMVGQQRPIWDFEDVGDWWKRANSAGIAPIVAVPTTAGTGSEVGRAGVLVNSETCNQS